MQDAMNTVVKGSQKTWKKLIKYKISNKDKKI